MDDLEEDPSAHGWLCVHIGVIMIAAVTGSGAFKDLSEVTLKEYQSVEIQEYRLTYTERNGHRISSRI